jgi:hypothetical protein
MGGMNRSRWIVIALLAGFLGAVGGALAYDLLKSPEHPEIEPIILEGEGVDEDEKGPRDRDGKGRDKPAEDRKRSPGPPRSTAPPEDDPGGGAPPAPPAPPADAGDDDEDDDGDDDEDEGDDDDGDGDDDGDD